MTKNTQHDITLLKEAIQLIDWMIKVWEERGDDAYHDKQLAIQLAIIEKAKAAVENINKQHREASSEIEKQLRLRRFKSKKLALLKHRRAIEKLATLRSQLRDLEKQEA